MAHATRAGRAARGGQRLPARGRPRLSFPTTKISPLHIAREATISDPSRRSSQDEDERHKDPVTRLANAFSEALRVNATPMKRLSRICRNSSASVFRSWLAEVKAMQEDSRYSGQFIAEEVRSSLDSELQELLRCIYGSHVLETQSLTALLHGLEILLLPQSGTFSRSVGMLNRTQQRNESVKEYFYAKCTLINMSVPEATEDTKIAFLHEGLSPRLKREVELLSRSEHDLTLPKYLFLLEEAETYLRTLFDNRPIQQNNWKKPWQPREQMETDSRNQFEKNPPKQPGWTTQDKMNSSLPQPRRQSNPLIKYNPNLKGKDLQQMERGKGFTNVREMERVPRRQKSLSVPVSVNGVRIQAVIDTGAEISVMNERLVKDCNLQVFPLDFNLITSNGSTSHLNTYTEIEFSFFDLLATLSVGILPNLNGDLLLGLDFLKRYKISVDPANNCLYHRTKKGRNVRWSITEFEALKYDERNHEYIKAPEEWNTETFVSTLELPGMGSVDAIQVKSSRTTQLVTEVAPTCIFRNTTPTLLPPQAETVIEVECNLSKNKEVVLSTNTDLLQTGVQLASAVTSCAASCLVIANFDCVARVLGEKVAVAFGEPYEDIRELDIPLSSRNDMQPTTDFCLNKDNEIAVRQVEDNQLPESVAGHIVISETLSANERSQMLQLLVQFKDLFAFTPFELETSLLPPMSITIPNNTIPVKSKPYRQPEKLKGEIEQQVREMLDSGIIRHSSSPWASPVVMVKKKNGNWRFCVDFRKLNSLTVGLSYPLPNIEETIDKLRRASCFTTLDLYSGFWQVPLAENDKKLTAFTTHCGLYEFNKVCFGLKNSPTHFQRCLDMVIARLPHLKAMVYIDDIVVWGSNFFDHLQNLERVLQALKDAKLKLQPNKCRFAFNMVNYLGHQVSAEGVSPDNNNVKVITSAQPPKTIRELRRFLGMTNYYRKFVDGYSKIAEPLYTLLRNQSNLRWTEDQDKAFNDLKLRLIKAPVLVYFEPEANLILTTDASGYAIGSVLHQQWCNELGNSQTGVNSYYGRGLTASEKRYTTTEREFLAIVDSIKHFRVYLFGKHFTVICDHKPIVQIKDFLKSASERIRRWCLNLMDYNFDVKHKEGRINFNADYLSRLIHPEPAFEGDDVFVFALTDGSLAASQASDLFCELKIKELASKQPEKDEEFTVMHNILHKRCQYADGTVYRAVVPMTLRTQITKDTHEKGHFGRFKTLKALQMKYWWPEMQSDVYYFVRRCEECGLKKRRLGPTKGALKPLAPQVPSPIYGVFCLIGLDLIVFDESLLTKKKCRYIVVVIDYLSHYAVAKAITNQRTKTIINFLNTEVFLKHGYPHSIITDNGANLVSEEMNSYLQSVGVKHVTSSPMHPRSNGLVEKMNGILKSIISVHVAENRKNWDEVLDYALCAYNSSPHTTTGYSPFYLLYGIEYRDPLDNTLLLPQWSLFQEGTSSEAAEIQKLREARFIAYENILEKAADLQDKDLGRRHIPKFEAGECVLYYNGVIGGVKKSLWQPWEGPYIILNVKHADVYEIVKCSDTVYKRVVNGEKLRKFYPFDTNVLVADDV